MRKIIMVALASSTFGGVLGAIATAATQSQASPAAIAAAVVKVQDQKAERSLATIANRLATVTTDLRGIETNVGTLDYTLDGGPLTALRSMEQNLQNICLNTEGSTFRSCLPPQFIYPSGPVLPQLKTKP